MKIDVLRKDIACARAYMFEKITTSLFFLDRLLENQF